MTGRRTETPPTRTLDLPGAVELVRRRAAEGVAARGRAEVVVPGGRSPHRLFAALRAAGLPGPAWRLHLADERCVAPDDPRRNGPTVTDLLGAEVLGPPAAPTCAGAASAWVEGLADVGTFDLVILGIGGDGHVASLFPGDATAVGPDAPDVVAVVAPDPVAPRRITLSAARLARTRAVLLVVDGPGKDAAVASVRSGADRGLPTASLGPAPRWLVDLRRP